MISIVGTPSPRLLTTLATVKEEVPQAAGRPDATVTRLIRAASSSIAEHCGRQFQRERLRQEAPLPLRGPMMLVRYPIAGAAEVAVDGVAQAAGSFTLDGRSGLLTPTGVGPEGCWRGASLSVVYTGGWVLPSHPEEARTAAGEDDLLPAAVEEACLLTVAAWLSGRGRDPMLRSDTVEGVGGSSWVATADMDALPPQAVSLLASFRAVRGG